MLNVDIKSKTKKINSKNKFFLKKIISQIPGDFKMFASFYNSLFVVLTKLKVFFFYLFDKKRINGRKTAR